MPEFERPAGTEGSGATRKRLPELTQEYRQSDVPVLEQVVAIVSVDDELPVLAETVAVTERADIPVLVPHKGSGSMNG